MKIVATFLGLSIGDALGVPVEFMSRERIAQNFVERQLASSLKLDASYIYLKINILYIKK